jgi:hypothetical protein
MKRILLALVSLTLYTSSFAQSKIDLYDFSKGLMDMVSADRIPDGYTPSCLNKFLDADMGIVTRTGYTKYNTTALTGEQSVSELYNYKKNDGTKYIIAYSSNSLFSSTGNGSFTNIKQGLSSTARPSFTTALDECYGGNGVDDEFSFNGTTFTVYTVANSTNIVKAKYHCWFGNRMNYAGVTGTLSTLYYSELGQPVNLGNGTNWDYISQDDGDVITGIFPSPDGSYMVIFKNYSTWGRFGTNPRTWSIKCISPTIGCLYGTTVDYLDGDMVFMSSRGVERFDGVTFTEISKPIENQIGALWQLNLGEQLWSQDTPEDWNAGYGVNIDSLTYPGSIAISSPVVISSKLETYSQYDLQCESYYYQFPFRSNANGVLGNIVFKMRKLGTPDPGTTYNVFILNSSSQAISSGTIYTANVSDYMDYYNVDMTNCNITTSDAYILRITSGNLLSSAYIQIAYDLTGQNVKKYNYSSVFQSDMAPIYYAIYTATSSSYTSQILQASNWAAWGAFTVNDSTPYGTDIEYYIQNSSAINNINSKETIQITNGSVINVNNGRYLVLTASFTRTNPVAISKINSFKIEWISNSSVNSPLGRVVDGAYNVSVSTDSNTAINNVMYRYNRNKAWELHNDIYANSMMVYNSKFYTGSSQDNGFIYRQFVPNLYTDDGGTYESYLETKKYDLGDPNVDKDYQMLWVTSTSEDNDLNIGYRLDGSDGSYTNNAYSMNFGDMIATQKINFPQSTRSKYIQFKVGSTGYSNTRGMSLYFDVFPIQ